ncbi:MAG: hypothetical protein WC455_14890 [Dehalococcoidia bacterium]|jgi:hypothetical protein
MTVYIVLKNGNLDEVFSTEAAAIHHAKQLNKKWAIVAVIKKEVKEL